MIGTPITIKNHDTGEEIVLNDHATDEDNVIALQSFPTFETDVRAQNMPRQGAHGEFRLPTYYSGMSIVLQGVIAAQDEPSAWEKKKALDRVMAQPRYGKPRVYTGNDAFPPMFNNTVRLSFVAPSGDEVFIDATPIKAVSYDRPLQQDFMLNFQVILRANFPTLLIDDSTSPNTGSGSLGSISKGFKLPFTLPFSLGEEYIEGALTLTMSAPGLAVIQLNGSSNGVIVNPTITNLTNGSKLKIRRALSGSDRYFKIDGIYQSITDENGRSVQQYAEGDFIFLDVGENVLVYTADSLIPN